MNRFKELNVWQESIALTVEIYKIAALLPNDEKFGLKAQMQRCAVSIPSNIAEGCGRKSGTEFKHFLNIALGSAFELETQLILLNKLDFAQIEIVNPLILAIEKIQGMIINLSKSIK